jgi:hypothetical protein
MVTTCPGLNRQEPQQAGAGHSAIAPVGLLADRFQGREDIVGVEARGNDPVSAGLATPGGSQSLGAETKKRPGRIDRGAPVRACC